MNITPSNNNSITHLNMDKLKKIMKSNKTFELFMNICCQNNICIFEVNDNNWMLKPNNVLIKECREKKRAFYQESVKRLYELMDTDMEWIDEKMRIDKMVDDLKKNIKNLDVIISLLKDVYDDNCLGKMTREPATPTSKKLTKKQNYVLIEHFSN